VTHIIRISQFPALVAAHQAEVRGPQVENRWATVQFVVCVITAEKMLGS